MRGDVLSTRERNEPRVIAFGRGLVIMAVLASACLTALPASAQPGGAGKASPVVVTGAWIREAASAQSSTAAYGTLTNPSASPVTLVGADVDGAGIVELHEMKMNGEMMGMAKVSSIEIPARGVVALAPGGLHLMLFQLKRSFDPGGTATLRFRFADGTATIVRAEIRKKSAMGT